MYAKRTKTSETFIAPAEFDNYSKQGYVIFMARPTVFGTYKAIKVEVIIDETKEGPNNSISARSGKVKNLKPMVGFWNLINRA